MDTAGMSYIIKLHSNAAAHHKLDSAVIILIIILTILISIIIIVIIVIVIVVIINIEKKIDTMLLLLQANKGAKNHAVIMPDANPEATASALVGASMGAAGQRCMAISAAVFVGGIGKYKEVLISKAKNLKVSAGHEPGTDVGPVITRESKKRVEDLIESGIKQV